MAVLYYYISIVTFDLLMLFCRSTNCVSAPSLPSEQAQKCKLSVGNFCYGYASLHYKLQVYNSQKFTISEIYAYFIFSRSAHFIPNSII